MGYLLVSTPTKTMGVAGVTSAWADNGGRLWLREREWLALYGWDGSGWGYAA